MDCFLRLHRTRAGGATLYNGVWIMRRDPPPWVPKCPPVKGLKYKDMGIVGVWRAGFRFEAGGRASVRFYYESYRELRIYGNPPPGAPRWGLRRTLTAPPEPVAPPRKIRREGDRALRRLGREADIGPDLRRERIAHEVDCGPDDWDEWSMRARYASEGRIAALAARGALTLDQAWAASEVRKAFWTEARALGVGSAGVPLKIDGGGAAGSGVEDKAADLERLGRMREIIQRGPRGEARWAVVEAVCGRGETLEQYAGRGARGRARAMEALRDALDAVGRDMASEMDGRMRRQRNDFRDALDGVVSRMPSPKKGR